MNWPFRVTPPLLDVVAELQKVDRIHGWDLAARCGQSTPNVYRALDRLLAAGWVAYEWEEENPEPGKPRRRFYWFTATGAAHAPELLAERRGGGRPERRRRPRGGGVPGMVMLSSIALLFGGDR